MQKPVTIMHIIHKTHLIQVQVFLSKEDYGSGCGSSKLAVISPATQVVFVYRWDRKCFEVQSFFFFSFKGNLKNEDTATGPDLDLKTSFLKQPVSHVSSFYSRTFFLSNDLIIYFIPLYSIFIVLVILFVLRSELFFSHIISASSHLLTDCRVTNHCTFMAKLFNTHSRMFNNCFHAICLKQQEWQNKQPCIFLRLTNVTAISLTVRELGLTAALFYRNSSKMVYRGTTVCRPCCCSYREHINVEPFQLKLSKVQFSSKPLAHRSVKVCLLRLQCLK